MLAASDCPDLEKLRQIVSGEVPPAQVGTLESHLLCCKSCFEKARELEAGDTLIKGLADRDTLPEDCGPSQPQVRDLVRRLKALPTPASTKAQTMDRQVTDEAVGQDVTSSTEGFDFLSEPQAADELGRLGNYRILRKLGAGGMGVVFLAEDMHLERPVALKVMKSEHAKTATARQRFLREAKAAAALRHDNIVTVYQVGEHAGVPFLAMEFLEGLPLDQWLKDGRKPSIAQAMRIAADIAHGLAAAQEKGLLHRDIKPANIWLDRNNGRAKILDFGLARGLEDTANITTSGTIIGTPAYMAPEQAKGESVDHRADLFSLGCVLYELCTGSRPFGGADVMATLMSLATHTPPPPQSVNLDVPRELSDLIMQLLEKDPANRPASAKAVVAALAEFNKSNCVAPAAPLAGASAASTLKGGTAKASPRRLLAIAAGLLIAATIAFGVYQFTIATPDGTFHVKIDSKEVEARFKNGALELLGPDGKVAYTLKAGDRNKSLPDGSYTIRVAGADGLTVDVDEFTMKKGDKITVQVLLKAPEAAIKQVAAIKQERPPWLPKEVVGVLGTHRVRASGGLAALSPDGKLLVMHGNVGLGLRPILADGHTLQPIGFLGEDFYRALFSTDGKRLVVGRYYTKLAQVLDISSGKVLATFKDHAAAVLSVRFVPNSDQAVSSDAEGNVFLWNATTGVVLHRFPKLPDRVQTVAASPDGKLVVAAVGSEAPQLTPKANDFQIHVWRTQDGKEEKRIQLPKEVISDLAFSADGRVIYAMTLHRKFRQLDLATGTEKAQPFVNPGSGGNLGRFSVSHDSKRLVVVGHYGGALVDLATRQDPVHIGQVGKDAPVPSEGLGAPAFYPDGRRIAIGFAGTIRVFDFKEANELEPLVGHYRAVTSLAFTPDGKHLLSHGEDHTVRLWETASAREVRSSLAAGQSKAGGANRNLYVSADGKQAVLTAWPHGNKASTSFLWDVDNLRNLGEIKTGLTRAVFSPDNKSLITVEPGKVARVSLESRKEVWSYSSPDPKRPFSYPVFIPGDAERLLLTSTEGGNLLYLDAKSGKEIRAIRVSTSVLAVAPDGKEAYGAQKDGTVFGFSLESIDPTVRNFPKWHTSGVTSLAIARSGRFLASTGNDGRVIVYELPSGKKAQEWNLKELKGNPIPFAVNQLAFSPDSRLLATANTNGTIYLFRLAALPK